MEATTSIAVKAGTMVATGGAVADAVIFSDISYAYLALVGALVSMFGVIHELYAVDRPELTFRKAIVEIIKGIALGVLAIPFWYIMLTTAGNGVLDEYFGVTLAPESSASVSLLIAFGLAWYTVPIFDFIAKTIPAYVAKLNGKGK